MYITKATTKATAKDMMRCATCVKLVPDNNEQTYFCDRLCQSEYDSNDPIRHYRLLAATEADKTEAAFLAQALEKATAEAEIAKAKIAAAVSRADNANYECQKCGKGTEGLSNKCNC